MFMNPNSNNKLIVLSEEILDFGFCDYNKIKKNIFFLIVSRHIFLKRADRDKPHAV